MSTQPVERRKYPRISQDLPIRVAINGYDFMTSTSNISCTGAYCRIKKYLPPFTRVLVRLTLPIMNEIRNTFYDVSCKGVIVRSEDNEAAGDFNIAIFFNNIKETERKKIAQYVNQFLPHGHSTGSSRR